MRRTLAPLLLGRCVVRANLRRRDFCTVAGGGAPSRRRLLEGGAVACLLRHGKQLAMVAQDGRVLVAHLGMTGQLRWTADAGWRRLDHVHAVWSLDDGSWLSFRDPRRFGGLTAFSGLDELWDLAWSRLGPDGLEVEGEDLHQRLRATRRHLKAALLDQALIAGVGNIYADEALFLARLSPTLRSGGIRPDESARLAAAIREVLAGAVLARGSTLRDYVDANGEPGGQQSAHKVYGRGGMPCLACGARLRTLSVGQRTTVMCPVCQRRRRAGRPGPFSTPEVTTLRRPIRARDGSQDASGGRTLSSYRAG